MLKSLCILCGLQRRFSHFTCEMNEMFFRAPSKNELTELLAKEPNLSMVDLLQHNCLSSSARSENPAFLDYFRGKDPTTGEPRLRMLVDWAFTRKYNTPELDRRFRIFQLNRNASSILCFPSQKLKDMLMKDGYLFEVLTNWEHSETVSDPIFAGHFARVVERVILFDSEDLKERNFDLRKLIRFCINNVEILAYQGLLSHLALESTELFETIEGYGTGDQAKSKYFEDILREVVRLSMTIESRIAHGLGRHAEEVRKSLNWTAKSRLRRNIPNPMSMDKKNPVPVPSYHVADEFAVKSMKKQREIHGFEERTDQRRKAMGWEKNMHKKLRLESIQMKAYLLLSAIQNGIVANSDIVKILQTKEIIELLLMVCVYCDDFSMIAPTAARILKQILYGYTEEELVAPLENHSAKKHDDNGMVLVYEPEFLVTGVFHEATDYNIDEIISEYAEDIRFHDLITPKMAALFPIFWNYRYYDLEGEVTTRYPDMDIELERPVSDPDSKPETYHYEQPKGKTPLELYNHLLFEEPPMSDALCHEILRVIKFDHNRTAVLRSPSPDLSTEEFYLTQRAALRSDLGYLEFLRSKFVYDGKEVDMSYAPDALALLPTDKFFEEAAKPWRVAVNGHLLEFYLFNLESGRFQFDTTTVSYLQTHVPVMRYEEGVLDFERLQREFGKLSKAYDKCGNDDWRRHLTADAPEEPSVCQSPREI